MAASRVSREGWGEGVTSLAPVHELERLAEDINPLANSSRTSLQFGCQRTDLTPNPTWDLRSWSQCPLSPPPFPSHSHSPLRCDYSDYHPPIHDTATLCGGCPRATFIPHRAWPYLAPLVLRRPASMAMRHPNFVGIAAFPHEVFDSAQCEPRQRIL